MMRNQNPARRRGYKLIVAWWHPRATASRCVAEHVLIAEAALGRLLPANSEVHHVDGDRRNNANKNLVICQDAAYHRLLHIRQRIMSFGGNPNTDLVCSSCRLALPRESFARSQCSVNTGRCGRCRQCTRLYMKNWRADATV